MEDVPLPPNRSDMPPPDGEAPVADESKLTPRSDVMIDGSDLTLLPDRAPPLINLAAPGAPPIPHFAPPLQSPIPAIPLGYIPAHSLISRPGSWIALGIISLVLGAISVVLNLGVGLMWYSAASGSIQTRATLPPVLPASTLAPYRGEYLARRGLSKADRAPLLASFKLTGEEAEDRLAMLDRLLAEVGQDVFPDRSAATVVQLADAVTNGQGYERGMQNKAFKTSGGTVALATTVATFKGTGSTAIVYETTWLDPAKISGNESFPRHNSSFAIDQMLAQLAGSDKHLTPAQLATLGDRLASPAIFSYGEPPRVPRVKPLRLFDNGVLEVDIEGTTFLVLSDGRSIEAAAAPLGIDVSTGRPIQAPNAFTPAWPGSPALMVAQCIHCGGNVIVALVLMFGGYRLLADNPNGAALHLRWAALKFTFMVIEVLLVSSYILSIDPNGHSHTQFDIARGVGGVVSSIIAQSIYPIIVLCVLFAGGTRDYLSSRGVRLRLWDRDQWAAAWRAMIHSTPKLAFKIAGVALLLLAVPHGVSAVVMSNVGAWLGFGIHAGALILFALAGLMLLRFRPAPGAAAVILLAVLLCCSSRVTAQTLPASQPSAADAAIRQHAIDALAAIDKNDYQLRQNTVASVALMGDPAIEPLLHFMNDYENNHLANAVATAWQKNHVDSPSFRKIMVDNSMQFANERGQFAGRVLFDDIGEEPGLLPFWATLSFMSDSNTWRRAIGHALAIEPSGATVIAAAQPILHDGKHHDHQDTYAVLLAMKTPGRDAIIALLKDPDPEVREHSVYALTQVQERDKVIIAAVTDFAIDPAKDLDPDRVKANQDKLRTSAMNALYRVDDRDKHTIVSLLNSDRLPDNADRVAVLRCLSYNHSPLRHLEKKDRPAEEWASVQRVALAALADNAASGHRRLAALLDSKEPADRKMAILVLSESDKLPITAEKLVTSVDVTDPEVRDATIEILCRDPKALESPSAAKLMREEMISDAKHEAYHVADKLRSSGAAGRAVLIDALGDPAQPKQKAQLSFNELAGDGMSLFHDPIREQLFNGSSFGPPAALAAKAIVVKMEKDHSTFDPAALKVLRTGEPTEQGVVAQAMLSSPLGNLIGPATRARAQSVLHVAPSISAPSPAASAVAATSIDGVMNTSNWPDIAWWMTGIVLLVGAITGTVGFTLALDSSGQSTARPAA